MSFENYGRRKKLQLVKMPWTWPPAPLGVYTPTDPDALGLKIVSVHVDDSLDRLHLGLVHVTQTTPLDLMKLNLLHYIAIDFEEELMNGLQQVRHADSMSPEDLRALNLLLGHTIVDAILSFAQRRYFNTDEDTDIIAMQCPRLPTLAVPLGDATVITHRTTKTTISHFQSTQHQPATRNPDRPTAAMNAHPDLTDLRVSGLESIRPRRFPADPSSVLPLSSTPLPTPPAASPASGPPKLTRYDSAFPAIFTNLMSSSSVVAPPSEHLTQPQDSSESAYARVLSVAFCAAEALVGRPVLLSPAGPESRKQRDGVAQSHERDLVEASAEAEVGAEVGVMIEAEIEAEIEHRVAAEVLFGANGLELREKVLRFFADWPVAREDPSAEVEVSFSC